MNVHAIFKFSPNQYGGIEIDTTSNSGIYKELSPFILSTPPAKNFENLWQFSKVYRIHLGANGEPNEEWFKWHDKGWQDTKAHRYPMGKGATPAYSFWYGKKLGYIEARKIIYAPVYSQYVQRTNSFKRLNELYNGNKTIVLRDYDAYDHLKLGMTLKDVINNPNRKMGHAFVLIMILTGELEECLKQ